MTVNINSINLTGASSASRWNDLPWNVITKEVKRLQMRIAKAYKLGKIGKAKALQRILSTSFYAKCLAVKRVVSNKGSNTAGVDNILWKSSYQRMKAVYSLKRKGYKTKPLKPVYIPKRDPNSDKRKLLIPCLSDRAMQALWQLALEPIAETVADSNSYGFRPKRSVADAIAQCFILLGRKHSAEWTLEGDIKSCFDRLSHQWLLDNIPMDKCILKKFLKAGFVENGSIHYPIAGTQQGSICSPTLLVIALAGLEDAIKQIDGPHKAHLVAYADDFVICCKDRKMLEEQVKPLLESFLNERGLELSREKTRITHIDDGFDFLGHNIRKYNGKLLIKPSKASIKSFLADIRSTVKSTVGLKTEDLINTLNPKIRGWCNSFRHVVAKQTFSTIDKEIYLSLKRWMQRRHRRKSIKWKNKKYFRSVGIRNWVFSTKVKDKDGNHQYLDLVSAVKTPIKRHIKIRAVANPYDPEFKDYFEQRKKSGKVLGSCNK